MSLHIELPWTLSKAEGIYYQLMAVADQLPDSVRVIIGLEPLNKTPTNNSINGGEASGNNSQATAVTNGSRRNSSTSGSVKFGENEVSFERGLDLSYM